MNARRIIFTVAVIAVAAGAALVAGSLSSSTPSASAGSGGASAGTGGGGTQPSSSTPAAAARCRASVLEIWLGVGPGGGAAGSTSMPIEFTNTGHTTCTLYGYPGVSARSSSQLGYAAGRDPQAPSRTVILAPGASAHTVLQLTDVSNYPPATCGPATASVLRVYPPGSLTSEDVAYRFPACSKAGPVYLSVRAVSLAVGIPGQP